MLVKNSQLANPMAIEAINLLAQAKIPARAGFVMARNLQLISDTAKLYETSRQKLVDCYASRDEKGVIVTQPHPEVAGQYVVTITPDKQALFSQELQELLDVETELAVKPIKLADIGNVEISTGHLANILWLIDEN